VLDPVIALIDVGVRCAGNLTACNMPRLTLRVFGADLTCSTAAKPFFATLNVGQPEVTCPDWGNTKHLPEQPLLSQKLTELTEEAPDEDRILHLITAVLAG